MSLGSNPSGHVQLRDGTEHSFRLTTTTAAALYRADAGGRRARVLAGWVRLPGGAIRGAVQLTTGTVTTVAVAPNLGAPTLRVPAISLTLPLVATPMTPDTLGLPMPNRPVTFRWVAMGDSYGSGEGNPQHGIADPHKVDEFSGLSWGSDQSMFVPDGAGGATAARCSG